MPCSTRGLSCMLMSDQSPIVPQCPEGAPAAVACNAGTYTEAGNLVSVDQCDICPVGFACSAGTSTPEPCAAGRYGATQGQTSRECTGACIPGHYCLKGSTNNASGVCSECHQTQQTVTHSPCSLRAPMLLRCSSAAAAGRFNPELGSTSASACAPSPKGTYTLSPGASDYIPCAAGARAVSIQAAHAWQYDSFVAAE